MKFTLHQDQMRVTSIPYSSTKMVIFSGVPLKKNSHKTNSGKYYVTIKADPDAIPVQPALGQHWSVKGTRLVEEVETGDFVMQQHTYESPEHIECSLPETGEQLIRFIARESDFKGIGESKARALWELLGKDFHPTVRKDTHESRERLRSVLSEDSINALFEGYAKYKNLAYCNWMTEHKIPASIQQRLLKYHGEESIEAIKQNPYVLIGFGMSFTDVDKLVNFDQFKITVCDHRRLSAALETAIIHQYDSMATAIHSEMMISHYQKEAISAQELFITRQQQMANVKARQQARKEELYDSLICPSVSFEEATAQWDSFAQSGTSDRDLLTTESAKQARVNTERREERVSLFGRQRR